MTLRKVIPKVLGPQECNLLAQRRIAHVQGNRTHQFLLMNMSRKVNGPAPCNICRDHVQAAWSITGPKDQNDKRQFGEFYNQLCRNRNTLLQVKHTKNHKQDP